MEKGRLNCFLIVAHRHDEVDRLDDEPFVADEYAVDLSTSN
jgi:hypothetical protein